MNVLVLMAAAVLAASPAAPSFRYTRAIDAKPGWTRLVLPDDVLDSCRPGLPDLRIIDGTGREVAFAFESDRAASARFAPLNLESMQGEGAETTFSIDRGPEPGFADAVTLEVAGTDFLKPVRIQASDDGADWKDVAKASVFSAGGARMLTLRIPDTNRRYLRFRLDDRNGEPLRPAPEAVVVHARPSAAAASSAGRPVALSAAENEDGESRYAATLAAANLAVTALRFQTRTPAFSRPVRVYERILFRDEVHRRLIAEDVLTRSPGSTEEVEVPLCGAAGRSLEIEIGDADAAQLEDLRATAVVSDRVVRFLTPEGGGLRLAYGSAEARPPRYDLARALAGGAPAAASVASLGPVQVAASETRTAPPRAPLPDPDAWTSRRTIRLPEGEAVAYLEFDDLPRGLADVRIVDAENRQVPFIVEQAAHAHRAKVRLAASPSTEGTRTVVRLEGLPDPPRTVDSIELEASAPDYFVREVRVLEEERDARGPTGTRTLGTARWERRQGSPAPRLRIPIARPNGSAGALSIEIDNGDNVPLTLAGAWISSGVVRIDFVFRPEDRLSLLSGNTEARRPAYDLEMLAAAILASPAGAARLEGAAPASAPARKGIAPWFWAAIGLAVVLLLFQLSRTLRPGG